MLFFRTHPYNSLRALCTYPNHPPISNSYVPYTPDTAGITACGIPQNYPASKEWRDKKVVLFAVPGAFTPGCSVRHLPGYIQALEEIKGKSVDVVAVLAFNDAFVMSAWGKANGIKDEIVSARFLYHIGFDRNARGGRTSDLSWRITRIEWSLLN